MTTLTTQEIDQLADYFSGTLPPEAKTIIEQRMANDPDFKAEAQTYAMLTALRRREWKAQMQQWEASLPPVEISDKTDRRWQFVLAASLLAVLLTVAYLVTKKPPEAPAPAPVAALVKTYFEAPQLSIIDMADIPSGLKKDFIDAYDKRRYAKAANLLQQMGAALENEVLLKFYLGIAQHGAGHYNEAIAVFQSLYGNPNLEENELRWFAALSLLAQNRIPEAKDQLTIVMNGGLYAEKARELSEKLQQAGF